MTTTETTNDIAHAAHSLYGYARNILTGAIFNGDAQAEAAELLRQQIQAAWAKALKDVGMPEDDITKLRL